MAVASCDPRARATALTLRDCACVRSVTCVGRCVSFLRVEPAGAPGKFHKAVVLIFPDILLRKARPILLTPLLAFLPSVQLHCVRCRLPCRC